MNFEGKVVLITGAASGIGRGASLHFAKLEAKVSIVDINEQLLNKVADEFISLGYSKPLPIVADVTKDGKRIIDDTINHFGQIDVLVNNAAAFSADTLVDLDINEFDRIISTNLRAAVLLTNLAVPYLEKTKGNVINISSIASIKAHDVYFSYSVAKAGLNQFTKCAAVALAPKGIRVNSILPSMIRTPLLEKAGIVAEANLDQFFEEFGQDQQLVKRIGELSDTSEAITYLASQSFINGILLPVDGGVLCLG